MKNRASVVLISLLLLVTLSCSKSISEDDYYNKASEAMSNENWKEAESNFNNIVAHYPKGEYTAKALFMVAFINANYTNNLDKAREYYQKFLDKYPDNELADDAEYELKHLGKSIDELPFLKGEADTSQHEASVPSSR